MVKGIQCSKGGSILIYVLSFKKSTFACPLLMHIQLKGCKQNVMINVEGCV